MKPTGDGNFTPERIRMRTCILCLNCLRNIAYIRGSGENLLGKGDYSQTILNNFIDVATLEWCKIFADIKGHHYWRKSVSEDKQETLFKSLIAELGLTNDEFDDYVDTIKTYRDKFVAHLDKKNSMQVPNFEHAKDSISILYQHLLDNETFSDNMGIDKAPKACTYYNECLIEAQTQTQIKLA